MAAIVPAPVGGRFIGSNSPFVAGRFIAGRRLPTVQAFGVNIIGKVAGMRGKDWIELACSVAVVVVWLVVAQLADRSAPNPGDEVVPQAHLNEAPRART